jgi:hypothetical protein
MSIVLALERGDFNGFCAIQGCALLLSKGWCKLGAWKIRVVIGVGALEFRKRQQKHNRARIMNNEKSLPPQRKLAITAPSFAKSWHFTKTVTSNSTEQIHSALSSVLVTFSLRLVNRKFIVYRR